MPTCSYCNFDFGTAFSGRCPRCGEDAAAHGTRTSLDVADVPVTFADGTSPRQMMPIERTFTEIRKVAVAHTRTEVRAPVAAAATPRFRPTLRPPVARVCLLDDGSTDGQWIRLRETTTEFGREETSVVVTGDDAVTQRHAEIVRSRGDGIYCWTLRDLHSTNGTWLRVSTANVEHGASFFIGSRRYEFWISQGTATQFRPGTVADATRLFQMPQLGAGENPQIRELDGRQRILVLDPTRTETIGSARDCTISVEHDPYLCPRHANVRRHETGEWQIEDAGSVNGVWRRVSEAELSDGDEFRIGEQIIRFRCEP